MRTFTRCFVLMKSDILNHQLKLSSTLIKMQIFILTYLIFFGNIEVMTLKQVSPRVISTRVDAASSVGRALYSLTMRSVLVIIIVHHVGLGAASPAWSLPTSVERVQRALLGLVRDHHVLSLGQDRL